MRTKSAGFTLIELMIVLVIASVLIGIAIPSFRTMVQNNRMTSQVNEMSGALQFARMEAVKRGNGVRLSARDGAAWASGIVVWQDANANNVFNAGEELRFWEPISSTQTLISTNVTFTFNGNGTVSNQDTFALCDDRTGETGRQINLLISGVISVSRVPCA